MKKSLIALSVLLSSSAFAHVSVDNDCNLELEHDLKVGESSFFITDQQKPLMSYIDGHLHIDGDEVELSRQQRQQLDNFTRDLHQGVGDIGELTAEALKFAGEISGEVLTEILGVEFGQQLQQTLEQAGDKVREQVFQDGDYWQLKAGDWEEEMENFFDEEFEQQIEETVTSSLGSVLMVMGQAMMNGEGSFEERMEAWAAEMEAKAELIEERAEREGQFLEEKAEALCTRFVALNDQEEALRASIPGWELDLISLKETEHQQ
ncbi:DUF2884 family protein [Gallaecimonas sp. GXIMD4217]|uniref:DUF2884 family protein n=1 Tax=Gallaecimonas sp. GXIMD4217 TaxID=3131927 RepID=UPI00311AE973